MHRAGGVANRGFHVLLGPADGGDGLLHVPDVVQGVEDAEDVHAVGRGALDEGAHHVVVVMAVADQVLAAQQHLEARAAHHALERAEPLPGVFPQKAQAGIKGGAAPDFQGPEADRIEPVRDVEHVFRPHARGQQGLVAVAQGDVRQQDLLRRRGLEFEGRRTGGL